MKIALITDDGKTISQHFGRAKNYLVATVENGQIINREMRDKLGHAHFANQLHVEEKPHQPHGMDADSHNKHLQMSETIKDCESLLCGGMGRGAYESIKSRNIRPLITEIANIEEAITAYLNGQIVDHIEKLH